MIFMCLRWKTEEESDFFFKIKCRDHFFNFSFIYYGTLPKKATLVIYGLDFSRVPKHKQTENSRESICRYLGAFLL